MVFSAISDAATTQQDINKIKIKKTIGYMGDILDKCPIAENHFTSCLLHMILCVSSRGDTSGAFPTRGGRCTL